MTATTHTRIAALRTDPALSLLHRSLDVYYGDPERDARMDAFYSRFVSSGDLVFDIGSHVGDHIGSFRRLGARVVAVEPQPLCLRALRAIYAEDDQVTVVDAACGALPGRTRLHVNSANPTVSTASPDFVRAANGAGGWEGEVWDTEVEVPVVTVDALIETYGVPTFAKIDVEGFEDEVLAGLSRPLPALSFEFTTIARAVAYRCLDRLTALGFDGFDVALGDDKSMTFRRWMSATELATYLRDLPHAANSGDVYCVARDRLDDLPLAEFAFPGPLRDKLVGAILSGAKTSTTGLLVGYEHANEPLPEVGQLSAVVDSAGRRVAVIELTDVRVIRLADVDLSHALAEGEGDESVAQWRAGHETFWHSAEVRAELGDPDFTVDDDTLVVTERFRLVHVA